MTNGDFLENITYEISKIGRSNGFDYPNLANINPFKNFFNGEFLNHNELDTLDGSYTRRELLTRYLILNAVLDQGPDVKGVRILLEKVTNTLYRRGITIFHDPIKFFSNMGLVLKIINKQHEIVKRIRSSEWALKNNSDPNRYNLFFAQSQRGIVSNQLLDYVIHRWGVPLSVPILLEDHPKFINSDEPLVKLLESSPSSEKMSENIKKDVNFSNFGLGSAIGNKACHLFAKWYIYNFNLCKNNDKSWSKWSYELPIDSNAGRVLFRSGFLLEMADLEYYNQKNVIINRKGKNKKKYLRVTNIRDIKVQSILNEHINKNYIEVAKNHLKVNKQTPRSYKIQIIPNAILYNSEFGIGEFDDGLLYIGTNYCFNHSKPNCNQCPISHLCKGKNKNKELIKEYST